MALFDWEGALPPEVDTDYHARDESSASDIKVMGKSPWHYKRWVIDKDRPDNDAFSFGRKTHLCMVEDKFHLLNAIPENWETVAEQKKRGVKDTRTVAEQKQDFIDHHNGLAVSQSDYEKLEGMYEAWSQDAVVQNIIGSNDRVETGFRYYDEEHDLRCRFRVDRINFDKGLVIEYKSALSAEAYSFKWAIIRYGYHISAAHYMRGLERLFPDKFKKYVFIVQEKTHPYACATYELSPTDIMFGDNLRSSYIRKIKKYTELDEWPGYTPEVKQLALPDAGYDMEDFEE